MDLFICWANVQRSQVAEGFAKNLGKNVISCASVEARKEKYNFHPEKEVTEIMKEKYNINISKQDIFYPSDIVQYLDKIENIYFLYNPKDVDKKIDKEVLIDNIPIWEYFNKIGKKYNIYPIKDPDGENRKSIEKIVEEIRILVEKTYQTIHTRMKRICRKNKESNEREITVSRCSNMKVGVGEEKESKDINKYNV